MNISALLILLRDRLRDAGIENYAMEARTILCHGLGKSLLYILTNGDREVTAAQEGLIRGLVEKRSKRIPLQYIIGEADFMGLSFKVTGDVLIPRRETEILVEEALKYIEENFFAPVRILDLGTGSGAIGISLAHHNEKVMADASDVSLKALEIARINAEKNRVSHRINFIQGDLFDNVRGKYGMIVSNPPYIRSCTFNGLDDEVQKYEPRLALDGGEDGLAYYRRIIAKGANYLEDGCRLFFEIGHDQAREVGLLMEEYFEDVKVVKDYSGNDRVLSGKTKSPERSK